MIGAPKGGCVSLGVSSGMNLVGVSQLPSAAKFELVVVHATYKKLWGLIKREGLKRMRRRHIHFFACWGVRTPQGLGLCLDQQQKNTTSTSNSSSSSSSNSSSSSSSMMMMKSCVSGFRPSCDLLLVLNLNRALKEGFCFFIAANGTILTEGCQGVLPLSCIETAICISTGQHLSLS